MHRIPRWVILTCVLLSAPAVPGAETELPWSKDLDRAVEAARKSGKRVFVDFTGDG